MKKFLVCLFVLGLTLAGFAGIAQAADTDTFNITVTCHFLSITLKTYDGSADYTSWDVGSKGTNTLAAMTPAQGIMVSNECNVATNLSAYVSGGTTTWSPGMSAGTNIYKLELEDFDTAQDPITFTGNIVTITETSADGDDIKTNLTDNDDEWVYGRFTTPTDDESDGAAQQITVTLKVRPYIE